VKKKVLSRSEVCFGWLIRLMVRRCLTLGCQIHAFCLALVINGDVQISVVYDPYSKRLFHAGKGLGAYKNDERILTPDITDLKNKYCFIPTGSRDKPMLFEKVIIDAKSQGAKIFFIPSYTYLATLVLEGSAATIMMAYGSPWDCAAISLIASEAGCAWCRAFLMHQENLMSGVMEWQYLIRDKQNL
jgi:fructose-1,6-bisphosphatase/inositol monophosphatase family enzyme